MGHGLSFAYERKHLGVHRRAIKGQKSTGAFQDVALGDTFTSGLEGAAELGALWAGNPDLQQVPIP